MEIKYDPALFYKKKTENEIRVYQEDKEEIKITTIPFSTIKHAEGIMTLIIELKQLQEMKTRDDVFVPIVDYQSPRNPHDMFTLINKKLPMQSPSFYERFEDEYSWLLADYLKTHETIKTKYSAEPLPIKSVEFLFDGELYSVMDTKQQAHTCGLQIGLIDKKLELLNAVIPPKENDTKI